MTALRSVGFLHPDEHFQILELVNLKDESSYKDLTIFNWDYDLKIRPWLQPFIYYLIEKLMFFVSAFDQALIFRLFNGLLAFVGLQLYYKELGFKSYKYIFTLLLIWFVPFLLVRTSSESLSFSFFLIGHFFFGRKKFTTAMFIWGLMFLIRYQMALLVIPIVLIPLVQNKLKLASFLKMLLALGVALGLGVLVDYWGYSEWTLAPYNYFYQNLVLGKSKDFGVEPFYYYFYKPLMSGVAPVSVIVLVFGLKKIINLRHYDLLSALVFFVFVHSAIAHKEVRFIMPVYILLSVYASLVIVENYNKNWLKGCMLISILVMLKSSLGSAHSRIGLYQFAYKNNVEKVGVFEQQRNFRFTMPFYMKNRIKVKSYRDLFEAKGYFLGLNYNNYKRLKDNSSCTMLISQYPDWIEALNFTNWLSRSSFYSWWKCE